MKNIFLIILSSTLLLATIDVHAQCNDDRNWFQRLFNWGKKQGQVDAKKGKYNNPNGTIIDAFHSWTMWDKSTPIQTQINNLRDDIKSFDTEQQKQLKSNFEPIYKSALLNNEVDFFDKDLKSDDAGHHKKSMIPNIHTPNYLQQLLLPCKTVDYQNIVY